MKHEIFTFVRQEGLEVTNLAILEMYWEPKTTQTGFAKLQELVSDWVARTKDGKAAWEYSGGDLNIGDLAMYDASFKKFALRRGITVRFIYVGGTEETISYDVVLPKERMTCTDCPEKPIQASQQASKDNPPHRDYWEDDPDYPASDWQYEVANGDTRQSYRKWVESKREEKNS